MAYRITRANVEGITETVNKALERSKSPYRFVIGDVYGRTCIYKGTIEKDTHGFYITQGESFFQGTKTEVYDVLHGIFKGINLVQDAKADRKRVADNKRYEKIRNAAILEQSRKNHEQDKEEAHK